MSTGSLSRTLGPAPASPMKSVRAASSVKNVLARARMVDVGRTNRGKYTLVRRAALSVRAPRPTEVPVARKPHAMIPHTSEYTAMFASGFSNDHARPRTDFLYWPLISRSVRFTRRFSVGFLTSESRKDDVRARSNAIDYLLVHEADGV